MKDKIQLSLVVLGAVVIIVALAYAGFWMQRTVNYNLYYKAQVEQQVHKILEQRIVQECLITQPVE